MKLKSVDYGFSHTNPNIKITLEHMEKSLDVLLTAYINQRHEPVGIQEIWDAGPKMISEIPIGKQADLLELCEDPIRAVLRAGITKMGEFIHAEVGDAGLLEVAERVAEKGRNQGHRIDVLDKCFDGIGTWLA